MSHIPPSHVSCVGPATRAAEVAAAWCSGPPAEQARDNAPFTTASFRPDHSSCEATKGTPGQGLKSPVLDFFEADFAGGFNKLL